MRILVLLALGATMFVIPAWAQGYRTAVVGDATVAGASGPFTLSLKAEEANDTPGYGKWELSFQGGGFDVAHKDANSLFAKDGIGYLNYGGPKAQTTPKYYCWVRGVGKSPGGKSCVVLINVFDSTYFDNTRPDYVRVALVTDYHLPTQAIVYDNAGYVTTGGFDLPSGGS